MSALDEVFRPGGTLARNFEGFVSRPSQRRLAGRIAQALEQRELLLVEAGTGTGKTFAYLVPALTSGLRVLISTGTRTLQDQLYTRDIPLLAGALGRPLGTALLKGRANYLCLAKLAGAGAQQALLADEEPALLSRVRAWAASTRSGDLAEVAGLGESHPLRAQLTSTREACSGARCAEFSRCHVFAARRAALEADLVVVNHHLLLADLALKEEGFGELLPGVDALILDEAHQLPDLAAEFFGVSCSSRQFEALLSDTRAELAALAVPAGAIARLGALVEQPLRAVGERFGRRERRLAWEELAAGTRADCAMLHAALLEFARGLDAQGDAPGIAQCAARARALAADLSQMMSEPADAQSGGARSVAVTSRGFAFSLLPYDISARFRSLVDQHPSAWIFTSATLALAGNFQHFSSRLGLTDAATLCLDSPFDYEQQALLYLPAALPDPATSGYTEAVLAAARPLLEASDGGAFLLFTSHRALRIAAQALRAQGWPAAWPLLVQNEAPRELLLRRFRESGRAVLLGTASFWEGVDVQGVALRLVVIDKLPFASPEDPQVRARAQYLQSQGINAFRDYQLPEAALALKQGVGRLIRSETDRGVVMLCDPRLLTRGYGRALLSALPPLRPTRAAEEAIALLRRSARELAPA
ncbi:MAG: ATP-dependent DNA helicase [Gammaproteobacteria bacterium]|nr:ATP-dependent DNA helicase [Gammaproteobacteria bacterium]